MTKMDYKSLISIVEKNNLNEYLSVLKRYTMHDKKYALFYLDKCDLLCRLFFGFHDKYVVFENGDIEYGRREKVRYFSNRDDAADYLWSLFVDYVKNKNDLVLLKLIDECNI